jgi:hypothetical protein
MSSDRDCTDPTHVPALAPAEHVHMGRCDHCGAVGIEHTPEDVARFHRDMLRIRLNRVEWHPVHCWFRSGASKND